MNMPLFYQYTTAVWPIQNSIHRTDDNTNLVWVRVSLVIALSAELVTFTYWFMMIGQRNVFRVTSSMCASNPPE